MVAVAKDRKTSSGFGSRLRAVREAKQMTLSELAEATGMHASNLARMESGEREPTWLTVLRLAEAVGVTPDAFLPIEREEGTE